MTRPPNAPEKRRKRSHLLSQISDPRSKSRSADAHTPTRIRTRMCTSRRPASCRSGTNTSPNVAGNEPTVGDRTADVSALDERRGAAFDDRWRAGQGKASFTRGRWSGQEASFTGGR